MEFKLGCNYWASHAGTEMWKNWDEDAVRKDLQVLSQHGVKWLRVFPNWRDFQSVKPLYGGGGSFRMLTLSDDRPLKAADGIDERMVERFSRLCELAGDFGCHLIVGLVTGWMSGRLFIPDALNGRNLYTDPGALLMQQRYCRGMVRRLKHHPSIAAWDLGNECNCMSQAPSRDAAACWTAAISNAIRAEDSTRPIVSGMHSLELDGTWTIADQAEFTDILTTHPYPHWVPHCREDKIGSIRTLLHATAESALYHSIGKRPVLVEELGTMGPMVCSDERAAQFLQVNLFSNWASGQEGVLWWCAFDQDHLDTPPYTWNMCERELGMMDKERKAKPVIQQMKAFSDFLEHFSMELPPAKTDAVCILSHGQDHWGIGYMTFILAKQAGRNIRFCDAAGELPESDYYLLPSINDQVMDKEQYEHLKARVRNGAKLYISNDFGFLTEFQELTGLRVLDSENANDSGMIKLEDTALPYSRERRFELAAEDASILSCDEQGCPCLTVHSYGAGQVFYLNFPLEKMLLNRHEAFQDGHHIIYRRFFQEQDQLISCCDPFVGITVHPGPKDTICVLINYSDAERTPDLQIQSGWRIDSALYGKPEMLPSFGAAVIRLAKA